jgi:hypothetical protein
MDLRVGLQDTNMSKKYSIVTLCKGYRAREDITNLPAGYLVNGSRNILTNSANRFGVRQGYTLDGQENSDLFPIESSYDWNTHLGTERNLRSYDDKLQFRYVDADDAVEWVTIAENFTSVAFNYAEFWDDSEFIDVLLFVNGTSNIYEWTGATATFASATATTVTKEGTTTWAEEGFYTAGTRTIVINGVTATYTGGEGTTTLTGVSVDFSATPVGDLIHQGVKTTANSSITDLPDTFENDLISVLYNQVYVGSLISRNVYVSKVNDYLDFSFTTPRVVGEGALFTFDGAAVALVPQEDQMYISAGKGQWYQTQFQLSADLVNESLTISKLKFSPDGGAKSQSYVSKIDNKIAFLNNEPQFNLFGRVDNIFALPDIKDISDVIRDDMNTYDFSNPLGSVIYWRNFIYISVPAEGLVLVYNIEKKWWESPQNLPIGKFSIIDGELYGHSYSIPETYKLFDGYNDNGNPILAIANFSYQNFGTRVNLKSFNEYYVEGYISSETTLTFGAKYDIDGCSTNTSYDISGTDRQIVCIGGSDASLGKVSLGKNPLGSTLQTVSSMPPKFRVIKTFPRKDFFEVQFSFTSQGVDQQWEVLAFGPQVSLSKNEPTFIKQ